MRAFLVIQNLKSGWGSSRSTCRAVDFEREPCPTIMGQNRGVGGQDFAHWWIELWEGAMTEQAAVLDKPEYRVMSVEEIRKLPWNGRTVISTFSGGGGSSTGYRMAGYRVLWCNEFVEAARATYAANWPDTIVNGDDIRSLTAEDILRETGLKRGELDLLDGSPPCASFSTAGKRHKSWGQEKAYSETRQRTDDLFYEFARILEGLQPKVFVAENVSGLVKGVAKGYFQRIFRALEACGYVVEAKLLDAQWLGVPQQRQRIFFVGVRKDLAALGFRPVYPTPLPYRYSVREALPWIFAHSKFVKGWTRGMTESDQEPSPTVTSKWTGNEGPGHVDAPRVVRRRSHAEYPPNMDISDEVAPTITSGSGGGHDLDVQVVEPVEPRVVRRRSHLEYPPNMDVSDGVAPTITHQHKAMDVQVEEPAIRTAHGERSVEEPAPTVMTHNRPDTQSELTLREPRVVHDTGGNPRYSRGDVTDRPCAPIQVGVNGLDASHYHVEEPGPETSLEGYAIASEWDRLKPGETSDKYLNLAKPDVNKACPTVTAVGGTSAGTASVTHPVERRKFTIQELKRICGFPDDYKLTGSYAQQWERCGRAVPPVLMFHVASTIYREIFSKLDDAKLEAAS